jgi:hypothetical protein
VVLAALVGHHRALHLGVHPPRVDRGDPHAVARLLGAQRVGEGAQRVLARRVGRPPGAGGQPGPGVQQHHPAAGGPQGRQQQPGQLGHRHHVDLELAPPGPGRRLGDGAEHADAGRVHQHVEPLDAAHRLGHRDPVGQLDRPRPGPGQLDRESLQRRRVPATQQQVVGGGQRPRHGRPDAPGRSGHQGQRTQLGFGQHTGSPAGGRTSAGMRGPPGVGLHVILPAPCGDPPACTQVRPGAPR